MLITKWDKSLTVFKLNALGARKYMGYNPKEKLWRGGIWPKTNYAAKPPSPWWPQEFLASAPINKLMIIAKRENHT